MNHNRSIALFQNSRNLHVQLRLPIPTAQLWLHLMAHMAQRRSCPGNWSKSLALAQLSMMVAPVCSGPMAPWRTSCKKSVFHWRNRVNEVYHHGTFSSCHIFCLVSEKKIIWYHLSQLMQDLLRLHCLWLDMTCDDRVHDTLWSCTWPSSYPTLVISKTWSSKQNANCDGGCQQPTAQTQDIQSTFFNLGPKRKLRCSPFCLASASLPAKRKNFARALARLWLPYESVTIRRRSTAGDWQMKVWKLSKHSSKM